MPGFTPISMFPMLWEAEGLSFAAVLDELVRLALARHARRQQPAHPPPRLTALRRPRSPAGPLSGRLPARPPDPLGVDRPGRPPYVQARRVAP